MSNVGDREELVVVRSCSRGIIHAGFTEVVQAVELL